MVCLLVQAKRGTKGGNCWKSKKVKRGKKAESSNILGQDRVVKKPPLSQRNTLLGGPGVQVSSKRGGANRGEGTQLCQKKKKRVWEWLLGVVTHWVRGEGWEIHRVTGIGGLEGEVVWGVKRQNEVGKRRCL